jgi:hypothetical protein
MRHIVNKHEFYRLSRALQLGNLLRQWTWEEFRALMKTAPQSLPRIVGVRHVRAAFTNKGNSGLMERQKALRYGEQTSNKENLLFDEGAVHDRLTIQGELMAGERGLYLRYSHLQCHQRTLWHIDQKGITGLEPHQLPHNPSILTPGQRAGRETGVVRHAEGLRASALLQRYMDDHSWDMVNQILGCQLGSANTRGDELLNFTYPVVEFACFDCPIGKLGWNTLIWEVRTQY